MDTRRNLFIKGMGVAAVAVATPSAIFAARPQNLPVDQETVDNRFSNAVADGVFSSFSTVIASRGDRTNLLVAAHAWRVARDHFKEIGFMQKGDQLIRDIDVNQVLSHLPTSQQAVVDIAAKNGVHLDIALLQEQVALLTPARVAEATVYLKSVGTEAFFDRVLNTLDTAAKRPTPPVSAQSTTVEGAIGGGMCGSLAAIAATLWILSGAYAFGCAVTLAACVVCCVASAIFGIAAGVINLIEVIVC